FFLRVVSWHPLPPPLCPQPSSSFSHIHLCFPFLSHSLFFRSLFTFFSYKALLLNHLSLSLVYLSVSSPSLSPPSHLSINHSFSVHFYSILLSLSYCS